MIDSNEEAENKEWLLARLVRDELSASQRRRKLLILKYLNGGKAYYKPHYRWADDWCEAEDPSFDMPVSIWDYKVE